MAAIVAGAGYMAGAAAGSALKRAITGPEYPLAPDTRIPGVTKAVIRKGQKKGGKPEVSVPQIDISQSMEWFQKAGDIQEKSYTAGLDYYQEVLKLAAVEINAGYSKANATLEPLSYSSNQALNEQMRMMGLDPISATAKYGQLAKESGVDPRVQSLLKNADLMKDPAARAAARQQIIDTNKLVIGENANEIASLNSQLAAIPEGRESWDKLPFETKAGGNNGMIRFLLPKEFQGTGPQFQQGGTGGGGLMGGMGQVANILAQQKQGVSPDSDGMHSHWMPQSEAQGYLAQLQKSSSTMGMTQAETAAKRAELTKRLGTLTSQQDNTGTIVEDFLNKYTPEYDAGYTGAEVEARVAATPGYQFQMEQGTKAIERQGAAAGMLGSGNTLIGLTKYGQQLGQNFYGVYMDNLAKIVNEGSGATFQIAQNQINQGKDYGALVEMGGAAGKKTAELIGDARANQYYKSGQLFAEAAQFNASMQYQGIQQEQNRQVSTTNAAIGAAAGIMNANTEQQKFNYGVFQNQQGGQAYSGAKV